MKSKVIVRVGGSEMGKDKEGGGNRENEGIGRMREGERELP